MSLDHKMPAKIKRLPELATNLWWSWTPSARELWRRLDYPLWRETEHNPVKLLQDISAEKLNAAAADGAFRRLYDSVMIEMDQAMGKGKTWFEENYPDLANDKIAYFSFEFGIHNTLPIYSGGLGILSGDHTKEGSDMGLPLVCVGFMYPQGYFRQRIPAHGWQEAVYQPLDFREAPIKPLTDEHGNVVHTSVQIGDETVTAKVWFVKVGRTPLYLLDSDVESNAPWNRELTSRLYYGGGDMRIKQEMLLGIGGVKLLRQLNYDPAVWHMNEGHSAFLLLELLREKVASGVQFAEAKKQVAAHTVFTTHTPVPAGHDSFGYHMMERFFWGWWDQLGISREEFMKLGEHHEEWGVEFNMTALPLRLSGFANGVSELHGEVSRNMWKGVFSGIENDDDVPISHVTNGVHVPTWIAGENWALFDRYLGPDWVKRQMDPMLWQRVADIPDEQLWAAHMTLKGKLMSFLQNKERRRWMNGQHDPTQLMVGGVLLDQNALTIGFARRFATYKRASLIFRDLERLKRIVLDSHRPVQIIFAGKAHPADDPGKHVIQEIYNYAKSNQLGGRIAVLEDYDMHSARYMKQGVDLWLNNPRRPREASGTSGMKAAMNGVPNLSILDGWWVEGYNGKNGWPIGENRDYDDKEQQDWDDANSIYDTLENEIVPLYYDRDRDNIPRGWIEVMKESIRSVTPQFAMRRMLVDYVEQLYVPAMRGEGKLKVTE